MRSVLLWTAIVAPPLLHADALSVGFRGGLPFGDAFRAAETGRLKLRGQNRFLVGPTLEVRLPAGFGFSIDALYRRYRFDRQTDTGSTSSGGGQWEFPFLFRYRFSGVRVRPFLAAGPTLQRLTGVTSVRNQTVGMTLGAGFDIRTGFAYLTPELRYSRRFQDPSAKLLTNLLKANDNQFDFVVGLTF
ncbi:MAG: PorT family protein [Bryobacteraceae bacterium]|nr:PorT family protein [Bryobacteraceae bacterium]MDW8376599.1 outer membrane beta-barrel protein [Bryobacterales bacterium]